MGNIILHIGCANRYYPGFVNSDIRTTWKGGSFKLDQVMDVTKLWPYEDETVDGIVSMHLFQQLMWRDLIIVLREAYRVLKKGGVMRFGVPSIEKGKPLDYLLGWMNINLFSVELLIRVLTMIGFSKADDRDYQQTVMPEFVQVDNRPEQTVYIEVIK